MNTRFDENDPRLDVLDEKLAQLETSAQPDRDLWPRVDAAMSGQGAAPPASSWRYASLAATVILGAMAAVFMLTGEQSDQPSIADERGPTQPADVGVDIGDLPPVDRPRARLTSYPGEAYDAARMEELVSLREQIQNLPPEQREIVEANLATIHKALAEIDAALANDPDSPALRHLLVTTYQRELETMNKVSRIAESVRTDL
ncbi:MAG: hypothetical protein AAFM91_13245 [Pseudomonadota bacterium]